jgi:hypothetical protein
MDADQYVKVQRYWKLRKLYIVTVLLTVTLRIVIHTFTWNRSTSVIDKEYLMTQALLDVIFFSALLGVAILVRPLSNIHECTPIVELSEFGTIVGHDLSFIQTIPAQPVRAQDASTTSGRYQDDDRLPIDGGEAA